MRTILTGSDNWQFCISFAPYLSRTEVFPFLSFPPSVLLELYFFGLFRDAPQTSPT